MSLFVVSLSVLVARHYHPPVLEHDLWHHQTANGTNMDTDENLIVGYRRLAVFLTEAGFPISKSTITKYCSPAINIGPPVKFYWGKLPAFEPASPIAWAKARLKPAGRASARSDDSTICEAHT